MVDDTLYIYGGQAKLSAGQKNNTWNKYLLSLSLRADWSTSSPPLQGLAVPDGPPAVANGYLWHNSDRLFLYGGLFSDVEPQGVPPKFALWQYDISASAWAESDWSVAGDSDSNVIERAAEGAGVTVPGRSLGFYFGGHLDYKTTYGWSIETPRVYLKSLLRFDMDRLEFTNITRHGLEKAGVPERADGVLIFVRPPSIPFTLSRRSLTSPKVPWGKEGILLAIGGGTATTFSQMNVVDVFDLASGRWTKQATSGSTPQYRVNACAVVASAADGSSHNVYLFGGQNLVPFGQQKQYDDMYILTVPAFSWIRVDMRGQAVPPPRAGHTCDIVGSQLVVVGGYTGTELSCDSPGLYIFDASALSWATEFSASAAGQQQRATYKVPAAVIDVVGGNADGGATVTKPLQPADKDSPMLTATPGDYKYTDTRAPTNLPPPDPSHGGGGGGQNVGAIAGAAVGGIVGLVLLLLAGALWFHRNRRPLWPSASSIAPDRVEDGPGIIYDNGSGGVAGDGGGVAGYGGGAAGYGGGAAGYGGGAAGYGGGAAGYGGGAAGYGGGSAGRAELDAGGGGGKAGHTELDAAWPR